MIKKGTTPTLLINLGIDLEIVEKIIFTFRQKRDSVSLPMLQKQYPGQVDLIESSFAIPFTQEETEIFSKIFYVEAQINYLGGSVDKTEITPLQMSDTLFTEVV